MDNLMPVLAVVAGALSLTASFAVLYALGRMETMVEKVIAKYDTEKEALDNDLMAIADVIQARKK